MLDVKLDADGLHVICTYGTFLFPMEWARRMHQVLNAGKATLYPIEYTVAIGKDGMCKCDCGTRCPLSKWGMEERCKKSELEAAGIRTTEST